MWYNSCLLWCRASGLLHKYFLLLLRSQISSLAEDLSRLSVFSTALLSSRLSVPRSPSLRVPAFAPGLVPLLVDLGRVLSTAVRRCSKWIGPAATWFLRFFAFVLVSLSLSNVVRTCAFRTNGALRRWIERIVSPWIDGWGESIQHVIYFAPHLNLSYAPHRSHGQPTCPGGLGESNGHVPRMGRCLGM